MDIQSEQIGRLFKNGKRASLSSLEQREMETRLRLFMVEHPARAPLHLRFIDRLSDFSWELGHARLLGIPVQPLTYAFVVLMCVSMGTSYVAEGALPGDRLYAVKVSINERLEGTLAVSGESKIDWSAELTSRRLEEAETLAAQGRLTPEASAVLQTQLNSSTNDFNTRVAALVSTPDSDAIVASAQSNLEASLNAHEQVLSALGDALPDVKQSLEPVLSDVQSSARNARNSRVTAETDLAAKPITKDSGSLKEAVQKKKKAAERALSQVSSMTAIDGKTLGTTTAARITSNASSTQDAITQGDDSVEKGDLGKAFNTFQSVLRKAQEERVNLEARKRLKDTLNISLPAPSGNSRHGVRSGKSDGDKKGND